MNIWFKLSPEQAQDYQVPDTVAQEPANSFYSTTPLKNLYHDGPWLLLSFQAVHDLPAVVTFQPCAVEFSFINEFDSFNPLAAAEGGKLLLNREEVDGLTELLDSYAVQMPNGTFRTFDTFEKIDQSQWENFHIYANPTLAARQQVFLQVHDPAADARKESLVSLIVITTPPVGTISRGFRRQTNLQYTIAFRQFSLSQLSDPLFSPLEEAVSRIELDRYGLIELAMLLQKVVEDTNQFPFGLNESHAAQQNSDDKGMVSDFFSVSNHQYLSPSF